MTLTNQHSFRFGAPLVTTPSHDDTLAKSSTPIAKDLEVINVDGDS